MPIPEKVGKRIFKVESNKQTDMITHEGCERVFERRNERDFPDYLKPNGILTMPEIVKPKQVASGKMKVSVDYIKKMLGDEGISEARGNLIRTLHEENVDIRLLNNLKRQLLDSKNVQRGNLLSIEEYIEIKNRILKGKQLKADHLLLEEIKGSETEIDIGKLVEVIDICNHFPMIVRRVKNKSNDIYFILSSNMRENFDVKASLSAIQDPHLAHNLELIWLTIHQKFKKLSDTFRFFDMDDNKTIDFVEFFSGLDKLRIKMSDSDALKCFEYLNAKGDGVIDYN